MDFQSAMNAAMKYGGSGMAGAIADIGSNLRASSGGLSQVDLANLQNSELQERFARMGMRWRVEDARAAGLHPLAALGAQLPGASPSFMADQGEDVSRAFMATRSEGERGSMYGDMFAALQLENAGLQNDLLRSQIVKMNQVGPGFPDADPYYDPQASAPVVTAPGGLGTDPGVINETAWAMAPDGRSVSIVKSKDVTERVEDDFIQQILWAVRNQALPWLGLDFPPPPPSNFKPPKGHHWVWDRGTLRYVARSHGPFREGR